MLNCEPGGGHKRVNWVRSGFIVKNNSVRYMQHCSSLQNTKLKQITTRFKYI